MLSWGRLDTLALDPSHKLWPLLGLHGMRTLCQALHANQLQAAAEQHQLIDCRSQPGAPQCCAAHHCSALPGPYTASASPTAKRYTRMSDCRALKTKGNTPKYGLIFHSSFIGRAKQRNKGRISRYLANKCSIASR